jgi:hypothetical protein
MPSQTLAYLMPHSPLAKLSGVVVEVVAPCVHGEHVGKDKRSRGRIRVLNRHRWPPRLAESSLPGPACVARSHEARGI